MHPYRLAYAQGGLYLMAYVPEYEQMRTFAVERIKESSLLEERFEPKEDLPDEAFPHSLGVHSGEPVHVEIAFEPSVADYIHTRQWHASQQIRELADGGVGDVARGLRRSRAPQLDPELRPGGEGRRAGRPGARHRRGDRRGARPIHAELNPCAHRCWPPLLSLLAASTAAAAPTAIRAARVIDASGRAVSNGVVVVDGDRITTVGTSVPPGATVIDLGPLTLMPGMIDVHTHMTYYWDRAPGTRPRGGNRLPAVSMVLAQANLKKTLEAGVTTVRDMGAVDYTDVAMRDLVGWAGAPARACSSSATG